MTSEIARKVVQSFREPERSRAQPERLTKREEEILDCLAQGYVTKEIAGEIIHQL